MVKRAWKRKVREVRFTLTTRSYKRRTRDVTDHGGEDGVVGPSATAQLKYHREARELLL